MANVRKRPAVEVCFIDVVARKAVRATGMAVIVRKQEADDALITVFEAAWSTYLPHMSAFVKIDLAAAEMILSPAYDLGFTEDELRRVNLEKLNRL
jgi:hypothetical protein